MTLSRLISSSVQFHFSGFQRSIIITSKVTFPGTLLFQCLFHEYLLSYVPFTLLFLLFLGGAQERERERQRERKKKRMKSMIPLKKMHSSEDLCLQVRVCLGAQAVPCGWAMLLVQ